MVHDRPFVVEMGPGSTTCGHLEYTAAQRPDIHATFTSFLSIFNHLGGHVHGCTVKRIGADTDIDTLAARLAMGSGSLVLGQDLGRTKVDILDIAQMVQQNI